MKRTFIAAVVLAACNCSAFAQSSVTLYGIIDAGIDYVNNSGGHSVIQAVSGVNQGSRWGMRGTEDIGGGTKVIFQLENGFNVFNGKLGQGGLEFGRQAWVGITNANYGTVTAGRMYDPLVDVIQPATLNGQAGSFFSHPSDYDNTDNGFRINNAVKYVTPRWGGLSVEGMYAFGGVAGHFGQNSSVSAGASYLYGPFYVGAAYFFAKNPAVQFPDGNFQASTPATPNTSGTGIMGFVGAPANMQTIAVGGTFTFMGNNQVGANFTNTRFDDANGVPGNLARFNSYEAWVKYYVTPALMLGGGYTFTDGTVNHGGANPRYSQANAIVDYFLSKRTDVYVMGVYQHASGGALAAIYQGAAGNQSTTNVQVVARVGIRHKF
ncbi:porin [Paraburkholderia nodosa]|uniref:porin n=1 Tax=Paraburkholderia nodosa TaxID=392320 RepID=UPI00047F362C|nr:porin [Paraburkholderia nodosa]